MLGYLKSFTRVPFPFLVFITIVHNSTESPQVEITCLSLSQVKPACEQLQCHTHANQYQ